MTLILSYITNITLIRFKIIYIDKIICQIPNIKYIIFNFI